MCARRRSFRKESSGTPHDGGNPGHRDHVLWEGASNGQRAVKPRLARMESGDLVMARRSMNRSVPHCDGRDMVHSNRQIVRLNIIIDVPDVALKCWIGSRSRPQPECLKLMQNQRRAWS